MMTELRYLQHKWHCIKDIEKILLLYGNRLLHNSTDNNRFGMTNSIPGMQKACETDIPFTKSTFTVLGQIWVSMCISFYFHFKYSTIMEN